MSLYILEVVLMRGGDWTSRGFHERGSGVNNEDPLVVSGKERALKMNLGFAQRRTEIYRSRGHKARILQTDGRIVLDWDTPLVEQQKFTRENSHRYWTYRGLYFIENCISGLFFHRFCWPSNDGPERSVSGTSCEEIIERMFGMGGDVPDYLAAHLDKVEPPAATPAAPQSAAVPTIKLETNQAILGIRPGSIRP